MHKTRGGWGKESERVYLSVWFLQSDDGCSQMKWGKRKDRTGNEVQPQFRMEGELMLSVTPSGIV